MPLGTYVVLLYEARTEGFEEIGRVRTIAKDELHGLAHLLVDSEHSSRLDRGDVCVIVEDDIGHPTGLQWVNLESHADRYLGRFSRPEPKRAYINQTFVNTESRSRGHGKTLMSGSLAICDKLGVDVVRLVVDIKNKGMQAMCESLGFDVVGRQVGLRIGRTTVRLNL